MEATINSTNIKEYLENGENETIEFKSGNTPLNVICKVVAAFANTKGGILILGFHEQKGIIGVSDNEINRINQAFALLENPPEHIAYVVPFDKKKILVIEVKKNTNTLTYFQGTLLIRKGERIALMSADDIKLHYQSDDTLQTISKLSESISIMNQSILRLTGEIAGYKEELSKSDKKNFITGFVFCILGVILGAIVSLIL